MSLFSLATQTRFTQEGEDNFNTEYPCILDRLSLDIVAGTSQYALPDYVMNIRRITWLGGWKVYAINHRRLREWNLFGTESANRPYNYIFNNIGQNTIQFFVSPSDSVPILTGDLWGSDIANGVIVEFWRTADHSTFVIPPFFSTPLLKAYMNFKLYSIEGKGQNLKAAKYFNDRWTFLKEQYSELMNHLAQSPQRTVIGQSSYTPTVLYPHLSISKFGVSVDEGN